MMPGRNISHMQKGAAEDVRGPAPTGVLVRVVSC